MSIPLRLYKRVNYKQLYRCLSTNVQQHTAAPHTVHSHHANNNNTIHTNVVHKQTSHSHTQHNDLPHATHSHHTHTDHTVHSHAQQSTTSLQGTFYQRTLPSHLISFTSNQGKKLFLESMNNNDMQSYFMLANQYVTQNEPSYCGPATLAMCLNALQLDPMRVWKGRWRWYSESMLQTCNHTINQTIQSNDDNGLSFEQFLLLAECNNARVEAFRSNYSTINNFRHAIITACRHTDIICVVSFSRKALGQTGSGHYSPIAGYHAATDRVLILDVARFKYPAYWCSVSDLWHAMNDIDTSTGLTRGYFLMSRADNRRHSIHNTNNNVFTPLNNICYVAIDRTAWNNLSTYFCATLPVLLAENKQLITPAHIFGEVLRTLPIELSTMFTKYSFDLAGRYSDCNVCSTDHKHTHTEHNDSDTPTYYQSYKSMLPTDTTDTQTHRHHHPHTRASIYSLLPLLQAIKSTELYKYLDTHITLQVTDNNTDALSTKADTVTVPLKYSLVSGLAKQTNEFRSIELELTALLLYACPEQIFSNLNSDLQTQIAQLRDSSKLPTQLKNEVHNLRTQLGILADYCNCSIVHNNESNAHSDTHTHATPHITNKRPHRFVSKQRRKTNTT